MSVNDWRYTKDPALSQRDQVRLLIGDTDSTDRQLSDAEIDWTLTQNANVYMTAGQACRSLAARYARKVDRAMGDLKISYSQMQKSYLDLAFQLEQRGTMEGASVYAGGISKSDKAVVQDDTDRQNPNFRVGQDDNPQALSDIAQLRDDV